MNDAEFLKQFEARQLHEFSHRSHIRMAWLYLRAEGFEQGSEYIRAGLRRLTAAHGAPQKYHETITRFWIHLVHYALTLTPEIDDFDTFLAAHEHLLDGSLLKRHYSTELLTDSRGRWAAPDLKPLPGVELEGNSVS